MSERFLALLGVLALAAGLAACGGHPSPAAPPAAPAITLAPCQLGRPDSGTRLAARCGVLSVPEDRSVTGGRKITLRVAVVPAISRSPAPDPLFFITGGPGMAATEDYPSLAAAFQRLNEKRAVVLVDQRGAGGSHPLLCPGTQEQTDSAAWATACVQELDADPRFYTTRQAIEDLDQVRAALGYQRINLYGVSYGTRVALSYLRQYPQQSRSVILDGVVPQDEALGSSISGDAQAVLESIFLRCAADSACGPAFPSLRNDFAGLLARLDREPARLLIAHPTSGLPTELTFTRDGLALAVRLFSYQPETVALLPLLIHEAAATGDLSRLAAQSLIVTQQLEGGLNMAMHNSVVCSEDVPFFVDDLGINAREQEGYLGLAYRELQRICAAWPHTVAPADFKLPVTSDVPVLLFSGEYDPVTPPSNGARAAATLRRSLHVMAPGQGHGVILRGCASRMATDFVESGTVDGLATGCLQQLRPYRFFVSPAGPW